QPLLFHLRALQPQVFEGHSGERGHGVKKLLIGGSKDGSLPPAREANTALRVSTGRQRTCQEPGWNPRTVDPVFLRKRMRDDLALATEAQGSEHLLVYAAGNAGIDGHKAILRQAPTSSVTENDPPAIRPQDLDGFLHSEGGYLVAVDEASDPGPQRIQ